MDCSVPSYYFEKYLHLSFIFQQIRKPLFKNTIFIAAHDCRAEVMKVNTDKRLWEAQLLLEGLHSTSTSADQLRNKPAEKDKKGKKK